MSSPLAQPGPPAKPGRRARAGQPARQSPQARKSQPVGRPAPAADRLSLRHQKDVAFVAGSVTAAVASAAMGADLMSIDTWFQGAINGLITRVQVGYAANRNSSMEYLRRHAALSGARVQPMPGSLDMARLRSRLEITGPAGFKSAVAAGATPEAARRSMATNMAGVADESVRNGDRDVVTQTVRYGHGVVGWRRRLSGHACGFCAMLASRGAVYGDRAGATIAKTSEPYHPHCHCWAEPLYSHQQEPAGVRRLQAQWRRVTAGHSGKDAQRVWRSYWEKRQPLPERVPVEPVPDLVGSRGLSSVPAIREMQIENRIRQAYGQAPRLPGGGVAWLDIRPALAGVSDDEAASALWRMYRADEVSASTWERNAWFGGRVLGRTEAEYQAGALPGFGAQGRDVHAIEFRTATPALHPLPTALASEAGAGAAVGAAAEAVAVRSELSVTRSTWSLERATRREMARITGRPMSEFKADWALADLQSAKEMAEGVLRGLERYPEANISRVGLFDPKHWPAYDRAYAMTLTDRGEILFNSTFAKDRATALQLLARDASGHPPFHPHGTGSWASMAEHEFGHVVDLGTLGARIRPALNDLLERRRLEYLPEELRRSRELFPTDEPINPRVLAEIQGKLVEAEVSSYALRSADELVAEALADVMANGANAGQLSREIVDLLDAEYAKGVRIGVHAGPLASEVGDARALRAAAKARQADIEARQSSANLLAEMDQLLATRQPLSVMAERLAPQVLARGYGTTAVDEKLAAALRTAVESGDPAKIRAAVTAQSKRLKVTTEGGAAGKKLPWDRASMRTVSGEVVQVEPALVTRVPVKAAKAPAVKAAPAKKAAAPKAPPKPKAPPAPEKLSLPALKTELKTAGVPDELTAGVPKPVLARWTASARANGADAVQIARMQTEVADARRAFGKTLADAMEFAAGNPSERALAAQAKILRGAAERALADWPELKSLEPVLSALERGDQQALARAVKAAARKHGLTQIGADAGKATTFDRASMEAVGRIADGAPVTVVRPGYEVTINGERVVLVRPKVVQAAEPVAPVKTPRGTTSGWIAPDRKPVRTATVETHSAGPLGNVRVTRTSNEMIEGRTLKEHAQIIAGLRPGDVAAYLDWHGFTKSELEQIRWRQVRLLSGDTSMTLGANMAPLPFTKAEIRDLIVRDAAQAGRHATPGMRAAAKRYAAELGRRK